MDYFSENSLHVVLIPDLKYWLKTPLSTLALLGHQFVQTSVTASGSKSKENFHYYSSCQILLIALICIFH